MFKDHKFTKFAWSN